jgi:hypothetical protein
MNKNLTEELEERHTPVWARPYGTGPMAPWYASGDDDEKDDDAGDEDDGSTDDSEDENEDDDSEGQDEEWKAPTRQEWRKMQRQLKRANKRDADLRFQQKNGGGQGKESDQDAEAKAAAAKEEGKTESDGRWKPIVVRQAAKAAFVEAGVSTSAMKRVLRMLDMDEIDIDDEGEVDGLDEQIADIKDELPELFGAQRRPAKSVDGGNKGSGGGKAKSSASLLAARMTGGR